MNSMARFPFLCIILCLTSTWFAVTAQNFSRCSTDTDCTAVGCTCPTEVCADVNLFRSNLAQCPNCATNAECATTAGDACLANLGKCRGCADQAATRAVEKCVSDSSRNAPPSITAPSPAPVLETAPPSAPCSADTDCTVAGCTCPTDFCVDLNLLRSNLAQCPNCSTNSDCTAGAGDACITTINKCRSCANQVGMPAVEKCVPDSSGAPPPSTATPSPTPTTETAFPIARCSADTDCTVVGCTCLTDFCADVSLLRSNVLRCPNCATNSDCVATAGDECITRIGKCRVCTNQALASAVAKCGRDSSGAPPPSTPAPSTAPATGITVPATQCSVNTDCAVAGCTCVTEICADMELFRTTALQCPNCATDADCTATAGDVCLTNIGKCRGCRNQAVRLAITKCNSGSTTFALSTAPTFSIRSLNRVAFKL